LWYDPDAVGDEPEIPAGQPGQVLTISLTKADEYEWVDMPVYTREEFDRRGIQIDKDFPEDFTDVLAGYVDLAERLDAMQAQIDSATGGVAGSYTHNQSVVSATWVINHNLGFNPNVSVIDSAGSDVEGDVTYDDVDNLTIVFSAPFSGSAYLS
jgi:hypothetical protein